LSLDYGYGAYALHAEITTRSTSIAIMFPHMSARPSDIYTVRLANTETQHSLANRLRKVVAAGGAAWTLDLLEGSGFMLVFPVH
jgi:hypothetical protein